MVAGHRQAGLDWHLLAGRGGLAYASSKHQAGWRILAGVERHI